MRRFVTTLALAAALVGAGCGDDDDGGDSGGGDSAASGDKEVRAGLDKYVDAFAENDPQAACDQMTESAAEDSADEIPGADSCEDAHKVVMGTVGPDKREEFRDEFKGAGFDAKVDGDTAELTSPKAPGKPIEMALVDDEWKLDQNLLTFTPKK